MEPPITPKLPPDLQALMNKPYSYKGGEDPYWREPEEDRFDALVNQLYQKLDEIRTKPVRSPLCLK